MNRLTEYQEIEDLMNKAHKIINKLKRSGIPLEVKIYNLILKIYTGYYGRKGLFTLRFFFLNHMLLGPNAPKETRYLCLTCIKK